MALGVLNNISAIYAQNNLSNTQASLSKTLQQLSSGSGINSGADDAAGLSLANGLQASTTALSQSASNASEGVDFLQVADGGLSQVTSLLNRAVTLATEASNGTLNSSQQSATQAEYSSIMSEINTISGNTEYNGINVFKNATNVFTSDGTVSQSYATSAVGATDAASLKLEGILVTGTPAAAAATGGTDSLGNSITTGDIVLTSTDGNSTFDLNVIGVDTPTISMTSVLVGPAGTGKDETDAVSAAGADGIDQNGNAYASGASIYTDPDTSNVYVVSGSGVQGVNGDLSNAADAKAALKLITTAITSVAAERGTVGASINTLSAVGNVMTTQSTNTLAAENDVTATDYGQATSDMSKFQILSQTGIAALSQANQAQQLITKLLQ